MTQALVVCVGGPLNFHHGSSFGKDLTQADAYAGVPLIFEKRQPIAIGAMRNVFGLDRSDHVGHRSLPSHNSQTRLSTSSMDLYAIQTNVRVQF